MIKGGDIGFTKTPKKKPSVFKKAAKTIVKKGIKFAVSPLSLGITAGTILYKGANQCDSPCVENVFKGHNNAFPFSLNSKNIL